MYLKRPDRLSLIASESRDYDVFLFFSSKQKISVITG